MSKNFVIIIDAFIYYLLFLKNEVVDNQPLTNLPPQLVLLSDMLSHDIIPTPLHDFYRELPLLDISQLTPPPPQVKEVALGGVGGG